MLLKVIKIYYICNKFCLFIHKIYYCPTLHMASQNQGQI